MEYLKIKKLNLNNIFVIYSLNNSNSHSLGIDCYTDPDWIMYIDFRFSFNSFVYLIHFG